jgi:SHS family lactate transporter-like MFS transporter
MTTSTSPRAWWREPTRAQWFSLGAAWMGWVLDAFDFTVFVLVMDDVAREFGVRYVATTASLALTLLARLVGGYIAGAVADRWGRRLPLMIAIVWFAVCDGAVALAPSFGWVLVLRTLFGFGMGAEWTAGTTLAMENWPQRSRGIASGFLQGSWAIGYLAAAVASAFILPRWGWRGMFVAAALPALFVLPIRFFVPENPEFRRSAARRGPREASPLGAASLGKIVWASLLMALGFGAYYGLSGLYPTLLRVELHQDEHARAVLVALFNVGMMAGSIATGVIAARRGVAIAIALPALASLPLLPLYLGVLPSLLPLGAFAGGAIGVCYCGVVPKMLTGLFDPDVRARAVGLVYHVGAALAAFVTFGEAAIAQYGGVSLRTSVGIVAGACEAALVLAIVAQRVTRPGMLRAAAPAALGLIAVGCASADGSSPPAPERTATTSEALDAVATFGANPGNLLMYRYVPSTMPSNAPLVVMLHGCLQTASDFSSAGIDAVADQYKFYVVYAQQQAANNPDQCFDWFGQYNNPANKANITRGKGENESIKEMVDKMKADFSVDATRVYVIGFSSGAAMASVMMAAWPDVFAAGGIDAGLPYDCPSASNSDVFACMNPGKTQTPAQWSQAVRAAYPSWNGPWPRASIWQGTQDTIVGTTNSVELVKQWTDLHGLTQTPTTSGTVDGQQRDVFADANSVPQVERWQIANMSHGFAVDPATSCGMAGSYIYDEHICTVRHMIAFFGLNGNMGGDGGGSSSGGSSGGASSGSGGSSGGGSGSGSGGGTTSSGGSGSPSSGSSGFGSSGGASGDGGDAVGTDGGGAGIAGCSVTSTPTRDGAGAGAAVSLLALAMTWNRRRNKER